MHKPHCWIRHGLFLLLCLLVAGALQAEPVDAELRIDAGAWEIAGNGMENTVQLAGTTEVALKDFCDTSSSAGTSASCETQLNVPAGTCPNGVSSKGCRTVGGDCSTLFGSGKWCKRCYVKCKSSTCAEDPVDGDEDGTGYCDADAVPIEP